MRKILLVTIDFWPKVGGVANYYFNLSKKLDQDKICVLTNKVISDQESVIRNNKDIGFKIYRRNLLTGLPIWPKWWPMFYHIWRIVKKEKIELIWVGEVLPTGMLIWFLNKFLRLPYIVSCHGNDILQVKKFFRKEKLARRVLQGAKLVTVNSRYTADLAESLGVESDKIRLVHPGVGIKDKKVEAKEKEELLLKYNLKDKKVLLSIGRLVERKGFDKVIRSLEKVAQQVPDLVYVLIGTGEDEQRLKELISKNEKILFINQKIDDAEKWAWFEICDVFIMVARKSKEDAEGFGIVYLEANIFGKPVIAGNVGGVVDAVVDGGTGLLVDPESVEEIREAVIKLFKNKELREKLGKQGRDRALKEFGWDKIAEKFRDVLS